jgi:hypothetical protein
MTIEQLSLDFDAVKQDVEEWRPVPGYEGRYEVSNHGRVRSWLVPGYIGRRRPEPRLINPTPWKSGHCFVSLGFDGKARKIGVHELVLFAFVGPRPTPKHQGAHWDGNPGHNHLSNLRWATPSENNEDKRRHGRLKTGVDVYNCRLTQAQVDEIRADKITPQRVLAKKYNSNQGTIWRIRNGLSHIPNPEA